MRTWVLASEKGGVGKTTIATNLGVHACQCGERTVIADLDAQGSAPSWHRLRGGDNPSVVSVAPENLQRVKDGSLALGVSLLIIDTPGHLAAATLAAIRSATLVISPVRPSLFEKKLDAAVCIVNGIVPGKSHAAAYSEAELAASGLGIKVAPPYLCQRVAYVKAIGLGKGVTEIEPKKDAAKEIRALWAQLNELNPGTAA